MKLNTNNENAIEIKKGASSSVYLNKTPSMGEGFV
tara:strand:- start:1094 stop:1198 length:105 start_codon:yes stop_codon:yes gene_type:complete